MRRRPCPALLPDTERCWLSSAHLPSPAGGALGPTREIEMKERGNTHHTLAHRVVQHTVDTHTYIHTYIHNTLILYKNLVRTY